MIRARDIARCVWLLLLLPCTILADEGKAKPVKLPAKQIEFFEKKIRPILVDNCYDCHSEDSIESGLRVDSLGGLLKGGLRGPAIVIGKPGQSLLISAINHGELLQMPAKEKLPAGKIAELTVWVKMGAPWPNSKPFIPSANKSPEKGAQYSEEQKNHWAFQPPKAAQPPQVKDHRWVGNAIDQFILAALEAKTLKPAPPASKRILIRRATFDLTGLPPTPGQIQDFLSDDSPDAYARLIDRLLASPQYGERWGRHWLDVARYADSNGMDENMAYANAFRFRDYTIAAFNTDKPFDRFVHEQLAGDLLPASPNESKSALHERLIATGFLAIGPKMLADDDMVKKQMDIIDEQIDTTCRALMGLTMGCARCHAHKFDPFSMDDYYALAGVFKSTKTMNDFGVVANWHEYEIPSTKELAQISAYKKNVADVDRQLSELNTSAKNEFLAAERSKADLYMATATGFIRSAGIASPDGRTTIGEFVTAKSLKGLGVLLEAEKFTRGTVQVDTTSWGKDVGVLLQSGFAEYDIELPQSGPYQLELRYAAQNARPVELSINGAKRKADGAGKTTGGWYSAHQKWHLEGVFEFKAGMNVVRVERAGVFPHIDKLLIVKLPKMTAADQLKVAMVLGREKETRGAVLIEAEDFNRGTILKRGPVVLNGGNGKFFNEAEYDIDIPADGNYQLELLYASGAQRTFTLSLDGEIVNRQAANRTTGGFGNDQVQWFAEGIYPLSKGKLTLRIEQTGPTPHLDKLALIPTNLSPTFLLSGLTAGNKTVKQWAAEEKLNEEFFKQWIAYLRIHKDFPNAKHERFAAIVDDSNGPFRLPARPERFYPAETKAELDRLAADKKKLTSSKPVASRAMGVREGKIQNVRIHLRGSHLSLGKEVPRRFFAILNEESQTPVDEKQSGRLPFARWLTSEENPLTARVMVNRMWLWHFGTGLVRSPDNFGLLGEKPTNQALLDWLAVRFQQQGWSIKSMHRLMMLSSTYRMSTTYNKQADAVDAENRLYWRKNRRRMDAEEIRDSILLLAGNLNSTMSGQLLKNKNREYVYKAGATLSTYAYNRRSVYLPVLRSAVYEVFQAFDFADPSALTGRRATTTVAPQALFMMNSALVSKNTALMAADLLKQSDLDYARRLRLVFERALGRPPNDAEIARFRTFSAEIESAMRQQGTPADEARRKAWRSICRVLIASNEFIYIE